MPRTFGFLGHCQVSRLASFTSGDWVGISKAALESVARYLARYLVALLHRTVAHQLPLISSLCRR